MIKIKRNPVMIIAGVVLFCILTTYLVNISAVFNSDDTTKEDARWFAHKEKTIEGSFIDSKGTVIFAPEKNYLNDTTYLPLAYSYVLGYNHPSYATSGLRRRYEKHLYNDEGTGKGPSVQLTINDVIQNKAYMSLKEENYEGSVIVLNAKTAEIIALAGRRLDDYDINRLISHNYTDVIEENRIQARDETWDRYKDTEGLMVDPATGDYKAPGSIFKILTTLAAFKGSETGYIYDDTYPLYVGNEIIRNAGDKRYGANIDLQKALTESINTYYATLSMRLGEGIMRKIYNDFLVGQNIDIDFTTLKSSVTFTGDEFNLAQMGFGQGRIAISPLHIAMIGQSIVNDGKMLKPTIVKALYDVNGNPVVVENKREILTEAISPELCESIKEMMSKVTKSKNYAGFSDIHTTIYSKTGTAEFKDTVNATEDEMLYNSYFLCMTDDYVIVVSINNTPKNGGNFAYIAERILSELY